MPDVLEVPSWQARFFKNFVGGPSPHEWLRGFVLAVQVLFEGGFQLSHQSM